MKQLLLLTPFFVFGCLVGSDANTQYGKELATIYLVRHSEKELKHINEADPPLTICGEQRSKNLSDYLKEVQLDVVYSTDYIRTKATALPTALSKGLEITE